MIRNIILFIWFCLTSLVVLCIALVRDLPKLCENLRIKAEKIEQATKEFNEEQRRKNQR